MAHTSLIARIITAMGLDDGNIKVTILAEGVLPKDVDDAPAFWACYYIYRDIVDRIVALPSVSVSDVPSMLFFFIKKH